MPGPRTVTLCGRMMMEVLSTHLYIVRGRRVREKPYYIPALERLREVLLPNAAAPPVQGDVPLA